MRKDVVQADYAAVWGQNPDNLPACFSDCRDWSGANALADAIVKKEPTNKLQYNIVTDNPRDDEFYARHAWKRTNIADAQNRFLNLPNWTAQQRLAEYKRVFDFHIAFMAELDDEILLKEMKATTHTVTQHTLTRTHTYTHKDKTHTHTHTHTHVHTPTNTHA
jgi:hypothetical protein